MQVLLLIQYGRIHPTIGIGTHPKNDSFKVLEYFRESEKSPSCAIHLFSSRIHRHINGKMKETFQKMG
jgi:hypothetical protein